MHAVNESGTNVPRRNQGRFYGISVCNCGATTIGCGYFAAMMPMLTIGLSWCGVINENEFVNWKIQFLGYVNQGGQYVLAEFRRPGQYP